MKNWNWITEEQPFVMLGGRLNALTLDGYEIVHLWPLGDSASTTSLNVAIVARKDLDAEVDEAREESREVWAV